MTSLHERMGLHSDPIDRAVDNAEAAFVLDDKVSDVHAAHAQAALINAAATRSAVTPPDLAESEPSPQISADDDAGPVESQHRFAGFVKLILDGVRGTFARSPNRPKREKKHYPPRFSTEFETSLVDRELRRL